MSGPARSGSSCQEWSTKKNRVDSLLTSAGDRFQELLFETAVKLDQELYPKPARSRHSFLNFIQIFFNLFGILAGFCTLRAASPRFANSVTQCVTLYKSKGKPKLLSSLNTKNIEQIEKLMFAADQKNLPPPAILLLFSHPETVGPESILLGQLISYSLKINERLCPDSKLKLVQAIDSYALDMLPWAVEGFYAGLISEGHIAIDRNPRTHSGLQKRLFNSFHYSRAIFHILKNLKQGNSVCAALSGGVVHNARIFYTVREFAQRIYAGAAKPAEPKRTFEQKCVSMLTREKPSACLTGVLSENEKKGIISLMKEAGWAERDIDGPLKKFEEELGLQTPYRQRFFNILFQRICAKNKPLLILPLNYSSSGEILLNPAAFVAGYNPEKQTVTILADKPEGVTETEKGELDFVERFVTSSLNR